MSQLFNDENEVWIDIVGFAGMYQVSNLGRVKSLARAFTNTRNQYRKLPEKILKQKTDKDGYLKVGLRKLGCPQKHFFLHRLVCSHFKPNPENKPTVNHIDGNKKNNHIDNLEFASYKEQADHAYKTGLQKPKYNEESGNNFLKDSEIVAIRDIYKTGVTQYKIAEMFGCSQGHVSEIVNHKTRPIVINAKQ